MPRSILNGLSQFLQGALLTISGNNIGLAGGQFLQDKQGIVCNCCQQGCNFAVDIYHSSGVKFRDSVVQGSYGSAVRVQEQYDPGCGKPGGPPVATKWGILPGLARQPVFITNVTLLHHSNSSFFGLRGFWTGAKQSLTACLPTCLSFFVCLLILSNPMLLCRASVGVQRDLLSQSYPRTVHVLDRPRFFLVGKPRDQQLH